MIEPITKEKQFRVLSLLESMNKELRHYTYAKTVEGFIYTQEDVADGFIDDDTFVEVFFGDQSKNALFIHRYGMDSETPETELTLFVDPLEHPYRIAQKAQQLLGI